MTEVNTRLLIEVHDFLLDWIKNPSVLPKSYYSVVSKFNFNLTKNSHLPMASDFRMFLMYCAEVPIQKLGLADDSTGDQTFLVNGKVNFIITDFLEELFGRNENNGQMYKLLTYLRSMYGENPDDVYCETYRQIRSFVKPENYLVDIVDLKKFEHSVNVFKENNPLDGWYEIFDINKGTYQLCPCCGVLLNDKPVHNSFHPSVCSYIIQRNKLEEKVLYVEADKKMYRLNDQLYRYTLIPNISEYSVFCKLQEKYSEVVLSPMIDKFDIQVKQGDVNIWIDVKDYTDPFNLAVKLSETESLIKMSDINSSDLIVFCIPDHRRHIYLKKDYKKAVIDRFRMKNPIENYVICYESELVNVIQSWCDYE